MTALRGLRSNLAPLVTGLRGLRSNMARLVRGDVAAWHRGAMPFDQPPRPWAAPVTPVAVARAYVAVAPYAPGGHRGIDLRTRPNEPVRAPCAGRVTFRGRVAGGAPLLTVDCGRLRATLGRVLPSVSVGTTVDRGDPVGRSTGSAVDLSARRPDGSYLDPAPLLGIDGVAPPVAAPRRRPRGRGRTRSRVHQDGAVRGEPGAVRVEHGAVRVEFPAPRAAPRSGHAASLPAADLVARRVDGSRGQAPPAIDPVLVGGAASATVLAAAGGLIQVLRRRRRRPPTEVGRAAASPAGAHR